jgi:hypothetical protein
VEPWKEILGKIAAETVVHIKPYVLTRYKRYGLRCGAGLGNLQSDRNIVMGYDGSSSGRSLCRFRNILILTLIIYRKDCKVRRPRKPSPEDGDVSPSYGVKYLNVVELLNSNSHNNFVSHVIFEGITTVTMKNAFFWDVRWYGSCKKRLFGGKYRLHHQREKNHRARKNVSSNYHAECFSC